MCNGAATVFTVANLLKHTHKFTGYVAECTLALLTVQPNAFFFVIQWRALFISSFNIHITFFHHGCT